MSVAENFDERVRITLNLNQHKDEIELFPEPSKAGTDSKETPSEIVLSPEDLTVEDDINAVEDEELGTLLYADAYGSSSKIIKHLDIVLLQVQKYRTRNRAILKFIFVFDTDDENYFHTVNDYLHSVTLDGESSTATLQGDLETDESVYFADTLIFQKEDQFKIEYHKGQKVWALVYSRPLHSQSEHAFKSKLG